MHGMPFIRTVVCCEYCVRIDRCGQRVSETELTSLTRWAAATTVLVGYHVSWTLLINIFRACVPSDV